MLPEGVTAAGHEAARRLNLAIARGNANGADLPRLAAPAIGSAVGADVLETLLVGRTAGRQAGGCRRFGGRADGGADPRRSKRAARGQVGYRSAETLRIVTEAVQSLIEKRLPILRRNRGRGPA